VNFRENVPDAQLDQERASIEQEITSLTSTLGQVNVVAATAPNPAQKGQASAEATSIINQLGVLQGKLANLSPSNVALSAKVVQNAAVPAKPSHPSKITNGVIGLLVACILGVAAALVADRVDRRIRNARDLESRLGVPVWASVPYAKIKGPPSRDLVVLDRPEAPISSSFEELRAHVTGIPAASSIAFTSATRGEGKTFACANLGVVLARSGLRVVMVSGDVTKPRIEETFEVAPGAGLTDVLAGRIEWEKAVVESGVRQLSLLRLGSARSVSWDSADVPALKELLRLLGAHYHYVLVDGGPLLSRNGWILADMCDVVLYVANQRRTKQAEVGRAADHIARMRPRALGAVLLGSEKEHSGWVPPPNWTQNTEQPSANGAAGEAVRQSQISVREPDEISQYR
jgi:Mrp family chromosome partitioning ATPase